MKLPPVAIIAANMLAYSLNVFNTLGETAAVVTVRESQIEPLHADELLSVRALSAAA
jgi:hypothetical protein